MRNILRGFHIYLFKGSVYLPMTGVFSALGGTISAISFSNTANANKLVIENCSLTLISGGSKNTLTDRQDSRMTGTIM